MIEERIAELGFTLSVPPKPLASYIPAVRAGNVIFTAGQLPIKDGVLMYKGKLGKEINEDDGKNAAQLCAINCLSAIKSELGSLDDIDSVIKLTVFVNSAADFINQPQVANGASDFIKEVFGEKGKHVRSAVGVAELPLNAPVEIEMICLVR